jgi:hypothetical protein
VEEAMDRQHSAEMKACYGPLLSVSHDPEVMDAVALTLIDDVSAFSELMRGFDAKTQSIGLDIADAVVRVDDHEHREHLVVAFSGAMRRVVEACAAGHDRFTGIGLEAAAEAGLDEPSVVFGC